MPSVSGLAAQSVRNAILAAADHIESNPGLYRDAEIHIPDSLTVRASALGWIGYFAGYQHRDRCASHVVLNVLRHTMPQQFHWGMQELDTGWRSWFVSWRSNARQAARCLRKYADRYHTPAMQVVYEPNSNLSR
jgi:hypothetical protein